MEMINRKKAAMEMSVGTIVTIVLLMTVLIMGLVLVRTIFKSSTENINSIDQAVKNEITKLFAEDNTKRIIVYPPARDISIKKGESGGFGFSLRNNFRDTKVFSYSIDADPVSGGCQMTQNEVDNLIILGKSNSGIQLGSGNSMENEIFVKFNIPETTPLCEVRYIITVNVEGEADAYVSGLSVDLTILPN